MVLKGLDLSQHDVGIILCEFEDRKTQPLGYSTHEMAQYLVDHGYSVYVSEWHPVVRYGGKHQWRMLKPYPCELEDPDAWGKLARLSVRSRALPAGQSVQQEHAT
jgi:hypothetical protein